MKRIIIKLIYGEGSKPLTLEIPSEEKTSELIEHLIQGMGWLSFENGKEIKYFFEVHGKTLDESKTLLESGIINGDVIHIRKGDNSSRVADTILKKNPFKFKGGTDS